MAVVFLGVRYGLQVSRLCGLVLDSRKHLELAKEQSISLSVAASEEEPGEHLAQ